MDPVVESINRTSAGGPLTNASSVEFTVTFSEAVTGVAPFRLPTGPQRFGGCNCDPRYAGHRLSLHGQRHWYYGQRHAGTEHGEQRQHPRPGREPLQSAQPAFQAQQTYATAGGPYAVALGDLNDGDGIPDIAIADSGSKTVSVLLGNGNGTFQSQQTFATGDYVNSVAIGDVNGDEKNDKAYKLWPSLSRQVSGSRGFERGR